MPGRFLKSGFRSLERAFIRFKVIRHGLPGKSGAFSAKRMAEARQCSLLFAVYIPDVGRFIYTLLYLLLSRGFARLTHQRKLCRNNRASQALIGQRSEASDTDFRRWSVLMYSPASALSRFGKLPLSTQALPDESCHAGVEVISSVQVTVQSRNPFDPLRGPPPRHEVRVCF